MALDVFYILFSIEGHLIFEPFSKSLFNLCQIVKIVY